jgi:hypothetical protein
MNALVKLVGGLGARILAHVALPVAVVLVVFLGYAATASQDRKPYNKTREYKAASVRVLNRSAVMNQHKNYGITQTSGPVGRDGIHEVIRLGDVVTVKGQTVRIRHIFVTEIKEDMKWGGKVIAKKGDVRCVAVESEENLPTNEGQRDRLWVLVTECEPMSRDGAS